jgi:hypothetical protein
VENRAIFLLLFVQLCHNYPLCGFRTFHGEKKGGKAGDTDYHTDGNEQLEHGGCQSGRGGQTPREHSEEGGTALPCHEHNRRRYQHPPWGAAGDPDQA